MESITLEVKVKFVKYLYFVDFMVWLRVKNIVVAK